MMAPSANALLRVWEDNQLAHPVRRALLALAAAEPEPGFDGWAEAAIGARDQGLLLLHEHLFGSDLHTTTACPQCGERLESAFTVADLRSAERLAAQPAPALQLLHEGFDIEYRLPNSADLLHIATERGAAAADTDLLRRCVSRAQRGAQALDPATLPDDVVEHITRSMAQHDPDADVRIALQCPACGAASELRFDIVSYFWSALDDWAQRLLADVHALASAYGWSERAILALSPVRRQVYLDMVGA